MKLKNHQSLFNKDFKSLYDVDLEFKIVNNILNIEFLVTQNKTEQTWNTSNKFFTEARKNWGLWEHDVVEVFVQGRNYINDTIRPYLELQVSPLNQKFNLMIIEPRKIYYTPLQENFSSSVSFHSQKEFKASLMIDIPFKSKYLFANFFACLGKENAREYYALNSNLENKPDFHRPELFSNLNEFLKND